MFVAECVYNKLFCGNENSFVFFGLAVWNSKSNFKKSLYEAPLIIQRYLAYLSL